MGNPDSCRLKLPLELCHRAGLTHQQRLCWWLLTWQSKPEEMCSQRQQCLLSPAALQGHKDSSVKRFWILFRQMLLSWGDKKSPNFETDAFLYVLFIAVLKHQSFSKVTFLNYDLFLIFLKGKQVFLDTASFLYILKQ